MKNIVFGVLSVVISFCSYGQKPIIDTSVFDKWANVMDRLISNDGNYVAYGIQYGPAAGNGPAGGTMLVIQSTSNNWKKEILNAVFYFGRGDGFTSDSKKAVFCLPGDSLCIVTLGTAQIRYIPGVKFGNYSLLRKNLLAYKQNNPENTLILEDLSTGKTDRYNGVNYYTANNKGTALVIQTNEQRENVDEYKLQWLDLTHNKLNTFWEGGEPPAQFTFVPSGEQVCFFVGERANPQETALWQYQSGETEAKLLVNGQSKGVDPSLCVSREAVRFSKDGSQIFFKLIERSVPQAPADAVKVNIWNYKDPSMHSAEYTDAESRPKLFSAAVNISDSKITWVQNREDILWIGEGFTGPVVLAQIEIGGLVDLGEWYWNEGARPPLYAIDTRTGKRKLVRENFIEYYAPQLTSSPDDRWVIYYDQELQAYFSYDFVSGISRNMTKDIPIKWDSGNGGPALQGSLYDIPTPGLLGPFPQPSGVVKWQDDGTVLVYDENDIWQLDPACVKAPVCLTNGYGRRNHVRLRLVHENYSLSEQYSPVAKNKGKLVLKAFNTDNKYGGFYEADPVVAGDPVLLTMGPFRFEEEITKASNANVWIVQRGSDVDAPNYYITKDLKLYEPLSDLNPQKKYNWLTTELVHWVTPDGAHCDGVLYKPEDFDPSKKYPVICYYYEKLSEEMYHFLDAAPSKGNINIPYFVSHGYLVFVPDMHYKIGSASESIVECMTFAARSLFKMPFVDSTKVGIQGMSFGGYETFCLVTHTPVFAAAAAVSGLSDLISTYGTQWNDLGIEPGNQRRAEIVQGRIGASMWEHPELYINNSPIFNADQVTTPFLIVAGVNDNNVNVGQSIEFFTALHRVSNKASWMLLYDDSGHGLGTKDAMDFTIRLTQFFDHYLKGAAPPVWMTRGVPARLKGIETGLAIDTSGAKP